MLVGCATYCDAIKPLSVLSLVLQNESADIVMSVENTLKSAKVLTLMAAKGPQDWTTVKLVKNWIAESDEDEYQGVILPNFDSCLEQCKVHVLADLRRLEDKIKQHLEWLDTKLLQTILVFIETQSWIQKKGDGDEEMHKIYLAVDYIVSIFHAPQEGRAGFF